MGYYFFKLALCIKANVDITAVCLVAVALNFLNSRKRPVWHVYQVLVCAVMAWHVYVPEMPQNDVLAVGCHYAKLLGAASFAAPSDGIANASALVKSVGVLFTASAKSGL